MFLLAAGIGAGFMVFVAPQIREQQQLIHPTPNSVSTFLENYSQDPVIALFRENEGSWTSSSKGAFPGRLFITNSYEHHTGFAIESGEQAVLMQALRYHLYGQLIGNGAVIIDRYGDHGDPQKGFGFGYRIGQSVGQVTVFPIALGACARATLPPENIQDVTVSIAVSEKWFPHEFEAIQAGREIVSQRPPRWRES
jgi:hypothetical protein